MISNFDEKELRCGLSRQPFDHVVIDNFLQPAEAAKIEREFFPYDSEDWHVYSNAIEEKKTCNQWNLFGPAIYQFFLEVNSSRFVNFVNSIFDLDLIPDPGLHGGGLHCHKGGGNLNPHLDYSIHPKAGLQRKINLIYYCSSDTGLAESGTGDLGFWAGDASRPFELIKTVKPTFNRAVLFDTTQFSWHGLVNPLPADAQFARKSLAAYYLQVPVEGCDRRSRALFAPRIDQTVDRELINLIRARGDGSTASSVYITNPKSDS